MLYARDLYNNPDKRADIVGCEIEPLQKITVDISTGTATFTVRFVTQFAASGSSQQYAVGSKQVTVTYDALQTFLQKLMADAKQQNVLKNGTVTVVSGTAGF